MSPRLSIGEFSRVTHLSVRTLRRYHEVGLLEPADVDAWSNYRYYDVDQIATAQMIRRYRGLDMPVREIRELLSAPDDVRVELIARHLHRLETHLEQTRDAVGSLRRLLQLTTESVEVNRRTTQGLQVAAVGGTVEKTDVIDWYSRAMRELDEALAAHGVSPTGPPGGIYAHELYSDGVGELTVYLPVDEPVSSGRVASFDVPPADVATVVHAGNFSDLDVTYGQLGRWVSEHGLAIAGPVHERYLVGPRDDPHEEVWRTEIGWPVRPVSSGS